MERVGTCRSIGSSGVWGVIEGDRGSERKKQGGRKEGVSAAQAVQHPVIIECVLLLSTERKPGCDKLTRVHLLHYTGGQERGDMRQHAQEGLESRL